VSITVVVTGRSFIVIDVGCKEGEPLLSVIILIFGGVGNACKCMGADKNNGLEWKQIALNVRMVNSGFMININLVFVAYTIG